MYPSKFHDRKGHLFFTLSWMASSVFSTSASSGFISSSVLAVSSCDTTLCCCCCCWEEEEGVWPWTPSGAGWSSYSIILALKLWGIRFRCLHDLTWTVWDEQTVSAFLAHCFRSSSSSSAQRRATAALRSRKSAISAEYYNTSTLISHIQGERERTLPVLMSELFLTV